MADLRVALHQQANQLRYMVNDFKETISNLAAEPRIERRKLDWRKKERRNKPASSLLKKQSTSFHSAGEE
jgi:hypothetical protein